MFPAQVYRYRDIVSRTIGTYLRNPAHGSALDHSLGEFQDQYDNLAQYTNKTIDFLDVFANFIRQRCAVEVEYATKIRRLTKGFVPKKVKDDDYHQFSYTKAFLTMLNETNDIAGQHEVVSENLTSSVCNHLADLVKNLKEERKKCLIDGSKLKQKLIDQEECLIKSKKNYEKTFRESIKAQQSYEKADVDFHLSRAEVQKQRTNSQVKTQLNEEAKAEYAAQLKKFNELQRRHFTQDLPSIFEQLQEIEDKRICQYRDFIKASVDISQKVLPIINTCYENIATAADSIEPDKDTKLVIDKYKSGFSIPDDEVFQDLSEDNADSVSVTGGNKPNGTLHTNDKFTSSQSTLAGGRVSGTNISYRSDIGGVKSTLSKSRLLVTASGRKRGGLFSLFGSQKDDFSDLPPNQRRKKLQTKIDTVNAQIAQETAARDAMLRMREVYQQNPSMGNPLSIDGQLNENCQKLEKLKSELGRYETYLTEVDCRTHPPGSAPSITPVTANGAAQRYTSAPPPLRPIAPPSGSVSPGTSPTPSPSAATTNGSVSTNSHALDKEPAPEPFQDYEYGSEYGSTFAGGGVGGTEDGSATEFYDMPVLGTCFAIYPFDGESEGSIPMVMGEDFEVVELDQGDGWTRVRRKSGRSTTIGTSANSDRSHGNADDGTEAESSNEGFVPTTYVDITLYGGSGSPNDIDHHRVTRAPSSTCLGEAASPEHRVNAT